MVAQQTRPRGTRARTVRGPDGVATTFHDFGGTGPVLLFAHATGLHGCVWKPVVDHLLDRAHCIAVDLRGHGDSALPAGSDVAWEGFGRDVLATAQVLDCGPIIGVGHSLGGAALLMAELAAPGTFARMFLYEPAVHAGLGDDGWVLLKTMQDAMVDIARRRRAAFPSRADALAHYVTRAPLAQFQAAVLGEYVNHGFVDRTDSGGLGVALKCSPDTEARIYAGSSHEDAGHRLSTLTCPITLALGSETDELQRQSMAGLAAQWGSEPVVLPGVDHFGPQQQPKQFADAVTRHVLDT